MALKSAIYNAAALENKKVLSNTRGALIRLHNGIRLHIMASLTWAKMKTIRKSLCSYILGETLNTTYILIIGYIYIYVECRMPLGK